MSSAVVASGAEGDCCGERWGERVQAMCKGDVMLWAWAIGRRCNGSGEFVSEPRSLMAVKKEKERRQRPTRGLRRCGRSFWLSQ